MSAHEAGIAEQVSVHKAEPHLVPPTPSEPVSERARGDCVVILYI